MFVIRPVPSSSSQFVLSLHQRAFGGKKVPGKLQRIREPLRVPQTILPSTTTLIRTSHRERDGRCEIAAPFRFRSISSNEGALQIFTVSLASLLTMNVLSGAMARKPPGPRPCRKVSATLPVLIFQN